MRKIVKAEDIRGIFAERPRDCNKADFGYIALVGGSERYSGAIRLAAMANAAMRSGAGVVKLAAPKSLAEALRPQILESTLFPLEDDGRGNLVFKESEFCELVSKLRVAAFGMGIGAGPDTERALSFLLENYGGTLVVDADGLNCLARLSSEAKRTGGADPFKNARGRLVLTPHNMEFSRLSGFSVEEISERHTELAERYAAEKGAIVLLKGPETVVTDGGTTYLVDRGCPGMATAGSGDVLSGVLSAVLGYCGSDILLGTAAAAYLNGLAGELAQEEFGDISMLASDTAGKLPAAIRAIRG